MGKQTCGLDANQLLTDVFGTPFAAECREREELEEYARRLEAEPYMAAKDEEMFRRLERYFGDSDPVVELLRFRRNLILDQGRSEVRNA